MKQNHEFYHLYFLIIFTIKKMMLNSSLHHRGWENVWCHWRHDQLTTQLHIYAVLEIPDSSCICGECLCIHSSVWSSQIFFYICQKAYKCLNDHYLVVGLHAWLKLFLTFVWSHSPFSFSSILYNFLLLFCPFSGVFCLFSCEVQTPHF